MGSNEMQFLSGTSRQMAQQQGFVQEK